MKRFPFIGGPYKPPRFHIGKILNDARRGETEVTHIWPGPAQWPAGGLQEGRLKELPILCGDLIQAVATESAQAVAAYWRVSRYTVMRWRRALGVEWFTPGTAELWRNLVAQRLTRESRLKGTRNFVRKQTARRKAPAR